MLQVKKAIADAFSVAILLPHDTALPIEVRIPVSRLSKAVLCMLFDFLLGVWMCNLEMTVLSNYEVSYLSFNTLNGHPITTLVLVSALLLVHCVIRISSLACS